MQWFKEDFEPGTYVKCKDTFIAMGDGTEIPLLGYGTSWLKLDGKIIRLPMSLHVLDLDCGLFLGTQHGCNGNGNTLLICNGKAHLLFPLFTITQNVPSNLDLTINAEELTESDWNLEDHLCDGNNSTNFCLFSNCLNFINCVFWSRHAGCIVTCAQHKKQTDQLKAALGSQNKVSTETQRNKFTPSKESILPAKLTSDTKVDYSLLSKLKRYDNPGHKWFNPRPY